MVVVVEGKKPEPALMPEELTEELYRIAKEYEPEPAPAPREATADEIERFKKAVKHIKLVSRETFLKAPPKLHSKQVFAEPLGAHVCLERMAKRVWLEKYQDPEGNVKLRPRLEKRVEVVDGKAVEKYVKDEEFPSPIRCRTFPDVEMRCLLTASVANKIAKNVDMPSCELVKTAYACANDLSPTMAGVLTDLPRSQVESCIESLEKEDVLAKPKSLEYAHPTERERLKKQDYFLDEPIMRMPKEKVEEARKTLTALVEETTKKV